MDTQTRVARLLEMLANVAIIVAAVLFSAVLIKSYLFPTPEPKAQATVPAVTQKSLQRGDVVSVMDVDWSRNGRTLLLALSTTCRFCTDSAPFYQKISKDHGDTRLIAMFPQANTEGETYLEKLGVRVDEVRQVSFTELGITGTPTLLLIDNAGKVTNMWEGALPPEKENEILGRLRKT
jgi:thioredoxin-related protein